MTTDLAQLPPTNWEALCNRCGLCCFEKMVDDRGRVITSRIPCRFLDLHSRQCAVYDNRFEVGEDCQQLTPEVVATVNWLPEQCAYRQWLNAHSATLKGEVIAPRRRKKSRANRGKNPSKTSDRHR